MVGAKTRATSSSILDHLDTSGSAYGDVNPAPLDRNKLKNLYENRRATTDLHYGSAEANDTINALSNAAEHN